MQYESDEGYVRYEELAWRLKTRTGDSHATPEQHNNIPNWNLVN